MILFLEFVIGLFVLYLITQIFIPYIWPSSFERNWLFKKKSKTDEKVASLHDANRKATEAKEDVLTDAYAKERDADKLRDATKR